MDREKKEWADGQIQSDEDGGLVVKDREGAGSEGSPSR